MNSETKDEIIIRINREKEAKKVRRLEIIMVCVVSPILLSIAVLMALGIIPKGF